MFKGKRILITGGTGTVGRSLLKTLLAESPEVIRIYSRDEFKQFELQQQYRGTSNLRFLLGDVRDYSRLLRAFEGIDYIFHTAALKHVPACEYNPFEAVQTNIVGTQNVIQAALESRVQKVIFTSTDKAISPTNAMGATKLMAERLIVAAEYQKGSASTVFSAVRFGNVMGSRGSVIPLFVEQILKQRRITLTSPDMSRFMMTVSEATRLTMEAMQLAGGGEVFVFKMPVVRLGDFAEVIIDLVCERYGIKTSEVEIQHIGLRPGEKMYEELMTTEESKNAYEYPHMYAIPAPFGGSRTVMHMASKASEGNYSSEKGQVLTNNEIRHLLAAELLTGEDWQ
ncbi:putative nucleoside-diphosphate sugar epimerase [Desulfosporosinus acidiphilus SJ4]|uniref:Putative nucleoside-diphosphate sugar epimerase n=1 Tax=Desulfosporosinus acidiphilus (strain DSM 22704 / JCM 16185 / SJ4) TaxID=646529 RepID=I4DAA2_DESAJ|nr:UDP-N-acetylglucosamine 4,6-dehydratase family protein [Desulfosporosinus acidiphilus]AFM42726.1 putative nucleoside-diphosphate sugar epimerase [Desulfosporosinus acidiphilus SJ4]